MHECALRISVKSRIKFVPVVSKLMNARLHARLPFLLHDFENLQIVLIFYEEKY